MKQKKLMLLGGLRYLLPMIEAAHKEGYYVITCDYLPDNIAHRYSDEYCNVSVVDKEAVLAAARRLKIDGIMSFAVDPGVVTAAYVAEKMRLPSAGSYESIKILQNKDLFRKFLAENNFNVPFARGYSDYDTARKESEMYRFPVIVKPTDSAGSKGVSKVDDPSQLEAAFNRALANSIKGKVIIEEFIETNVCPSDSDCLSIDGQLEVVTFSAQRFDANAPNPFTPSAFSWPSQFTEEQERLLTDELQRIINLLKLKTSIYNVETRIAKDGTPYIMEFSPRGGGNRLAEMIRYGSGTDLIRASVRAAVGDPVKATASAGFNRHWAEIILHSDREGVFDRIEISPDFGGNIIETDLWVKEGDQVRSFMGANDAIGTLAIQFDDKDSLDHAMDRISEWCKIKLK